MANLDSAMPLNGSWLKTVGFCKKYEKGMAFPQRPHATAPVFGDLPLASLERRHRQLSHGVSGKSPNTGAVRWRGFENGTKMNEIPK